ncbi:RNA 2',3'-cyclic phosphodiesterase [Actinoplanes sp. NBRC 14428]|uniref:RNA 2',3'-cyclic phosphodiesterase n=1 Tax=Pseudosporangium ferrugineum TaxID=439699 RepID=A0A2T0S7U8_9ACTN|nr:RNA 2',3'-cyclic phosphodiesterase [Pseudosporangium ferrugineum]PRY29497.1 2'-5' RNA ligase [Pseudosporangium ferrugineum]BCJ52762.1 RNA 2',3'-cyclic phosphodiesterase [Actinoplanes sp. NBRC 14428]
MRLFVAVYPPDDVRRDLRRRLTEAVAGRRVRLTAVEKWHVTLAFLGEVPAERLPALEDALGGVTVPRGRELRLRGAGGFGGRVTWAGVEGDLAGLSERVRAAARQAGAPPDERPFTAHLTVMYAHDAAVSEALADYAGPPWALDGIALVRSDPGGAYTTLRTW